MKFSNRKSFTIIEPLIATILIGIIAAAFFSSLMTSFNYLRRVMELRTASLALQEEMSIIRELKFSDVQSSGGTFSSSSISSLKDAVGAIKPSPYAGEEEIVKITVGLDWTTFDGKPAHKTIVTLITDHGIDKK